MDTTVLYQRKQIVSAAVTPEQFTWLHVIAEALELDRSNVIREAIAFAQANPDKFAEYVTGAK